MTMQDGDEPDLEALSAGMPAALAALVLALEECGALSRERYRDILLRLWTAMPEDDAFDQEAQACARLLEFLERPRHPHGEPVRPREATRGRAPLTSCCAAPAA